MTAQTSRLNTNASTAPTALLRARLSASPARAQSKCSQPAESDRLAVAAEFDALALLAAADHREAARVADRGEQLVVLAEPEVVERRRRPRAARARGR